MARLIMMRHGQSLWNKLNQFTGWVDIPLSKEGVDEAIAGGKKIKDEPIDIIYTSTLIRAQMTAMLAMNEHSSGLVPMIIHPPGSKLSEWAQIFSDHAKKQCIPVYCSWHLNERMYGELQGMNKKEMAEKYGQSQVQIWRRSYDTPPPNGESLKVCAERTIPYFIETVEPKLKEGKNIFISAHGNSLRSIVMKLDSLTEDEVVKLELATGVPIIYEFKDNKYIKQDALV